MRTSIKFSTMFLVLAFFVASPCFSQTNKGRICGNVIDTATNNAPRGNSDFIAQRLNEDGQFERAWGKSLSDGQSYYCLLLPYGSYIVESWGENYDHSFWGINEKVVHWSDPGSEVIKLSQENNFFYLGIDLKPLPFYVYDVNIAPSQIPSEGGTVKLTFKVYSELGYPVQVWPTLGEFWKPSANTKKTKSGSTLAFSFLIPEGASNGLLKIGVGAGTQPNPQLYFVFKREVGVVQKGEEPPPGPR